jgi:hypothetical protein
MIGEILGSRPAAAILVSLWACGAKAGFPGEPPRRAAAESPGIAGRVVPPVAGVDLEQSLNYTDEEGLDLAWFSSFWDSGHGIARRPHPLELFQCVGYHNYFIH